MPPTVYGFHDGSACGYYRVTLPLDYLAHKGWTVQTGVGWDERAKDYRVIIGQRIGKQGDLPGTSTSAIWRRLLVGHRLVYETDDDFWTIDPWNYRAKAEHNPVMLDAVAACMRAAHLVTVSVPPLADICAEHNPNVRVLGNHIDGRLLDLERPRRDRVTVGWAGGDSHLGDWQALGPHLQRFLKRNPQVDLHVIGTDFAGPLGIPARVTGWQDLWAYYASIDFDIGLALLADTAFNRSKSPIKAVEYGALGVPVVASDVGPYRDYVLDGVTGFLVRHEHEWGRYLKLLASDPQLREDMGRKAKEQAAEWTIQRGWTKWANVYEEVAG
jgi:glycosyltransferase involved in cell wall biosynthesis